MTDSMLIKTFQPIIPCGKISTFLFLKSVSCSNRSIEISKFKNLDIFEELQDFSRVTKQQQKLYIIDFAMVWS